MICVHIVSLFDLLARWARLCNFTTDTIARPRFPIAKFFSIDDLEIV